MLYKVTPMMAPPAPEKAKPREPGQPRKKRKSAVYDADGHEVLISLMCLKCRTLKPLAQFGLRKMADGAIRNQPWCRTCRSGAGTKKPKGKAGEAEAVVEVAAEAAPEAPASATEESTVALQVMAAEAELPGVGDRRGRAGGLAARCGWGRGRARGRSCSGPVRGLSAHEPRFPLRREFAPTCGEGSARGRAPRRTRSAGAFTSRTGGPRAACHPGRAPRRRPPARAPRSPSAPRSRPRSPR